jgi:hypothetical protein
MNHLFTFRRSGFFAVVSTCVALLLPAAALAAPQKTYSLTLAVASAKYDLASDQLIPPAMMSVSIKNESPPSVANSNIGSFTVTLSGIVMVPSPGNPNANPPIPPSPNCPRAICSIDASGSVLTVTNISQPIQAQEIYPVTFQVSSCGDGTVTSAGVFGGSQLNGSSFIKQNFNNKANISCGMIGCGAQFTVPVSTASCAADPYNLSCVVIERGTNKDGVCDTSPDSPDIVNYFVTNTLLASNLLHVEWATDPTAAFAYQLNAATGGTPNVSWLSVNNVPSFIAASPCLADPALPAGAIPLPRRYGELAADVAATDKKITVTLDANVLPPPINGSITIGGERLVVTAIQNNKWTVTRRTAGTPIDPNVGTAYNAGQPVMFTPLPLVAANSGPYKAGNQAQMCQASDVTGPNPPDGTFSFWIVDIGDGFTKPGL